MPCDMIDTLSLVNIWHNLCAQYIMQNAELDEAQAGIKIAGRNINNLRSVDDATLQQKAKRN